MNRVGLVRPIVVFYAGFVAVGVVLASLRALGATDWAQYLTWGVGAFVLFCVLWSQSHTRAALIEKCLRIDRKQMQFQLLLSAVLLPLYPVLALPFIVVSAVMMTLGKCSL